MRMHIKVDAYDISCRISMIYHVAFLCLCYHMPTLSYIICTCLPCLHMLFALKDVCVCPYQERATHRYSLEGTRCRRIAPRGYLQEDTCKCIPASAYLQVHTCEWIGIATRRCGLIARHRCGIIPEHALESRVSRAYLSVCKGICSGMPIEWGLDGFQGHV